MPEKPKKPRDRYDVSGNVEAEYMDAAEEVLRNKKGIADLATLQTAEEESLARAYRVLLDEVRTDTPLSHAPMSEIIRQALARTCRPH
jgi:cell filamentation protein